MACAVDGHGEPTMLPVGMLCPIPSRLTRVSRDSLTYLSSHLPIIAKEGKKELALRG